MIGRQGMTPRLRFGLLTPRIARASIRGSIGYNVFTEHPNLDDTYDNIDTNLAVLYPVAENVVVRAELTQNHFTHADADPTSLWPGVDVSFPIGEVDLVLRPTLGIGLTEAPDWQIGLGIAGDQASDNWRSPLVFPARLNIKPSSSDRRYG